MFVYIISESELGWEIYGQPGEYYRSEADIRLAIENHCADEGISDYQIKVA